MQCWEVYSNGTEQQDTCTSRSAHKDSPTTDSPPSPVALLMGSEYRGLLATPPMSRTLVRGQRGAWYPISSLSATERASVRSTGCPPIRSDVIPAREHCAIGRTPHSCDGITELDLGWTGTAVLPNQHVRLSNLKHGGVYQFIRYYIPSFGIGMAFLAWVWDMIHHSTGR